MDYYNKDKNAILINRNNHIKGSIGLLEAHKNNILHRGFTICLFYGKRVILQHRRHPVFNGVFDLTCSSHPLYNNEPQNNIEAAYYTLKREWNIEKKDLKTNLEEKSKIYYKAKDKTSVYREHEICSLIVGTIDFLPTANLKYAYGYSLIDASMLKKNILPINKCYAPWVFRLIKLL